MGQRYERVLIPTDFSEWAFASVRRCPEIPGVREVLLLHVTSALKTPTGSRDNDAADPEEEMIRGRLEKEGKFLQDQGLSVTIRIEPSRGPDIARTILKAADATAPDLILIGARGAGRIREAFLGSVSHDVLRHAPCDVLIMHPLARKNGAGDSACPLLFSSILCPVDLSKVSEETIKSLQELDGRAAVRLIHVIARAESVAQLNAARARAEERLEKLRRGLEKDRIASSATVRMGDPVLLSVVEAERSDASVVLISRFGRFDYMKNIPVGKTAEAIALRSARPVLIRNVFIPLTISVRELSPEEFPLAEGIWEHYHQQKADAEIDRIFALFVEGVIAGVARCRRHPDGVEVDGVFVLEEFRDRGYARRIMQELVRERGHEVLYMHSTLELVSFYKSLGFIPIPENDLPQTIRERFAFAQGNMAGADVSPMKREPSRQPA